MSLAKELLAARRGRQPPDWLLEAAQDARRQLGSRGYAAVREAAVGGGLRPFDAMVAWQMAQGHSLDAAVRIAAAVEEGVLYLAAAIAARKRG